MIKVKTFATETKVFHTKEELRRLTKLLTNLL
jgi:hypothetical protein